MPQIVKFLRKTGSSGLPLPPVAWGFSTGGQGVAGSNPAIPTNFQTGDTAGDTQPKRLYTERRWLGRSDSGNALRHISD